MQTGKKGSKDRIEQAISMARIDAIERDDPGPPSQSHHWAPHVFLCVLLKDQHFILLVGMLRHTGSKQHSGSGAPCGAGMPPAIRAGLFNSFLSPSFRNLLN
jgi:hypothetical protein